jgi:lipocalin
MRMPRCAAIARSPPRAGFFLASRKPQATQDARQNMVNAPFLSDNSRLPSLV